jgi:catechol 2,3-dioxygenase-like lactoylglutathione lyase family enzyme
MPTGKAAASRDRTTTTDCVPFELCFGIANADSARQRLKKISLWPEEIRAVEIRDQDGGAAAAAWRALTFKEPRSTALDIGLAETVSAIPLSEPTADAPVLRNELVVIKTAAPEQALAFYGARLGLGLLFDRSMKAGSRLAQFSCGSSLLEISHDAAAAAAGTPDTIWGIGWSVASAGAAHRRLAAAGRNVSEVKDGAAPGTRVFTARDGTCGIPTIFVEHVGIR